jgi:quinoprotein glucose dehydrogenase
MLRSLAAATSCPGAVAASLVLALTVVTTSAGRHAAAAPAAAPADANHRSWSVYNGGPEGLKYSALDQINRDNVQQLAVAWTYRTGDGPTADGPTDGLSALQVNPIIVGDTLYGLGQNNKVFALEAATGKPRWVHRSSVWGIPTRRGLVYWQSRDGRDRRILFTVGPHLIALDAARGTPVASFGKDGVVTLYVDRDSPYRVGSASPGIIFEDLIIMGSVVGERYRAPPGHIRAYDVRTGEMRWVFHTVPQPGEVGRETWSPDSWKRNGGANVWGSFTLDVKRGMVFAPTGSPSYNFYGADRPGQNLFANCVLALDARTGKRIWHFQAVHHDLWAYDLTAQPVLATIRHKGKKVDAVIQVTKHGFVFVLDRVTGKPLFPVQERPVPASDVPGEQAWPTQPFPLLPAPVARQRVRVEDLTEFPDAAERKQIRDRMLASRNEGLFTPPSLGGTISVPGHHGGPLWGGGAFDPQTGMFYVTTHDQPSFLKLSRFDERGSDTVDDVSGQGELQLMAPWTFFQDSAKLPVIKPPWGRMIAIDMSTGKTAWMKLVGEEKSLTARGIPQTGHKYLRGGPVVTAGGLVFMAGTQDRSLRAFCKRTGALLWTGKLPFDSVSVPAIYEVGGRQFVAITATADQGDNPGDAVVAFALPATTAPPSPIRPAPRPTTPSR